MSVMADISPLQDSAGEVAEMLRLLANESRLLSLCQLAIEKEVAAGALAAAANLSQSALSQHLARLREEGVVATRREGTTVFYRIADANVRRILNLLKTLYCP